MQARYPIHNLFVLIFILLQCATMFPHGFAGDTLVELGNNQGVLAIKEISTRFFSGQKTTVCTYKEKSQAWKGKPVQAVAYCQSDVFFELNVAKNHISVPETITCSPLQLFYRLPDRAWIPAHELCEGDVLLCKNYVTTRLQSKKQVLCSNLLHIIQIKKHHTFFVGRQKVLTHNMFIPVATTIGMAIPFDLVFQAGAWGCMFGPVSFCCSIAVAGIVAVVAYNCGKEKCTDFSLCGDDVQGWDLTIHYNDAQAPGKPTKSDGFVPKKNWDGSKVKHPITGQVGWPDEKGNIWKPTGLGSSAHGGPHWDVISKDGKRHWNIMSGGKQRGSK